MTANASTESVRDFRLPDLGEGLEEGEIVEWHVSVGDVIDLNATVQEVAHFVDADARRRQVQLVLNLAPALAPAWADTVQVQQVLLQINVCHIHKHGRHHRVIQQPAIKAMHHGIDVVPAIQIGKIAVTLLLIAGLKILHCGHCNASCWHVAGNTPVKREAGCVQPFFTNQYDG